MTGANKSERFKRICDGVWRDRDAILSRCSGLSGEATLVRAVYWRLCNAWGEPGQMADSCYTGNTLLTYERLVSIMLAQHAGPHFDGAPLLNELVRHYRDETRAEGVENCVELKVRQG
ncbi:MAG TPA: hypothetical protein VGC66_20935 [Pyrinomonadaceae bacterium]